VRAADSRGRGRGQAGGGALCACSPGALCGTDTCTTVHQLIYSAKRQQSSEWSEGGAVDATLQQWRGAW